MPELIYDWYGTTIAVQDERSDRADRLWQFAFDGTKALCAAGRWEMLPGCMRREPVGGDLDSGEIVAYLWPVAREKDDFDLLGEALDPILEQAMRTTGS